jgi:Kef-type K+ transport system membrane component KefB
MVAKLISSEVLHFLIIVTVVLVLARTLGELCRKFKQPAIIGEIVAGIILGPTLLGTYWHHMFNDIFLVSPRAYGAFDGLANVGIILLMFIAGFEVDIKQIKRDGKQAAAISLTGIIFPFIIGFAAAWFFYERIFSNSTNNQFITSMFFGTALSITALSVITKILMDLDILKTKIGNIVLTSAMIDDFLGWVLFSIIMQMLNSKDQQGSWTAVAMVLLFAVFMVTIGRWIVNKMLFIAQKNLKIGRVITLAICLCFISAIVTEFLGVRGVFGAFLMGIAVGDSEYFTERHKLILHQFTVNIIAPLFFASVGLRLNFIANFNLEVVSIILAIACIAKLLGAGIGSRISGMNKNESIAVAFGMNARGSQEIVLGLLALQAKIIDEKVFEGLVVMTVVTIIISGPIMKYYFLKDHAEITLSETKDYSEIALSETE